MNDTVEEVIDTAPAAEVTETSTDTAPSTETVTTEFSIPDEYKDSSWATKVKSQDDLYKQLDNMDSLVGKKTIKPIDYETASEEEIAAYHESTAVQDIKDYTFGEGGNDDFNTAIAGVFQKVGLNKHQGDQIIAQVDEISKGVAEANFLADTSEDGYLEMSVKSFGNDHEKIIGLVENKLKEIVGSDEDKARIDTMGNNERGLIDRLVNSLSADYESKIAKLKKEYGVVETGAQSGAQTGGNSAVDVESQRNELRKEIDAMSNRPHTEQEKQEKIKQLSQTYGS